jgi:hypothetical protein
MPTTLRPAQSRALIRAVVPHLDGTPPGLHTTTVTARLVSFFPGWRLLDLWDESGPTSRHWIVFMGPDGDVVVADGRAETLYSLAVRVPIVLNNADSAQDYLNVFCAIVQTPEGRFQIVEGPEDLDWISDTLTTARREIGALLMPVQSAKRTSCGSWKFRVCAVLGRNLFAATAKVAQSGTVDIERDAVLATGLPVRDDRLTALG